MSTATVQTLIDLPLDLLISDENVRRTVNEASIRELADSIKATGLAQPILVRPVGKKGNFKLVTGQRRVAATRLLGDATIAAVVREMTDAEAREIQITENLQRENLPPLEEAQGFAELLIGSEVEAVAAKLGKSASYVTRRLKLLDAIKPVQEALKAGAIEVGHALELSRLSDDQQKDLLNQMEIGWHEDDSDAEFDGEMGVCKFCRCDEMHACQLPDGSPCSWADDDETVCSNPDCLEKSRSGETILRQTTWTVADLKHHIRRDACRNLNTAPFALNDAGLGEIACTGCPKRTMNAALLFNDLAGSDTCTDSGCFTRKCTAFVLTEIKLAAKAKRPLLKISDTYSSEKDVLHEYNVEVIGKNGNKPCDNEETAIWINGRNLGKTVQICRKGDCKIHGVRSSSSGSKSKVDASAERKKVLAKLKAKKAYRVALMKALATAPIPQLYWNDLNLEVCLQLIHHANSQQIGKVAIALGWPDKLFRWDSKKALRDKVASLSPPERLRIALLAEHCGEMGVQEYNLEAKPEDLERLAKLFAIDTKKLLEDSKPAEAKAAPAKPAKAPANKKAKKKGGR